MGYIGQAPANKVVTSADIEDGVVSAADLGANSVDSSELVDGSVDLSHLSATGTKSSSTYLRGDNTFATVSAGTALTGSTNNTIPTVTGANAITGETNLTYNGTILGCGADGANADLGVGLHIKTADSGASVLAGADELIIEGSGDNGISILTGTSATSRICFGDSGGANQGIIDYSHGTDAMLFKTADTTRLGINNAGTVQIGHDSTEAEILGGGHTQKGIVLANGTKSAISTYDGNPVLQLSAGADDNGVDTVIKIHRKGWAHDAITAQYNQVNYNTSSDYRLKENETTITDGIDRVKQLKPYKFNFKECPVGDPDYEQVEGFFAHEVSSIVPTAIQGEKDGVEKNEDGSNKLDEEGNTIPIWQGIDHSKMIPLLTSALQEAITKIETLEAKVTALENA